jgi:hypothetical protein
VSIQDEIFDWVQGFERWKQELFIRAASSPSLGEEDAEEIAGMLLGEQAEDARPREVRREDLPEGHADREAMVIESITGVCNVNAIERGQTLSFDPLGVNVVWGQNGAGKTGYSRVLKKAGRTLHVEEVLTNVYKDSGGRPCATLNIKVGEEERSEELDLDAQPPVSLARICVADSQAGQVYLTRDTEVDYVPAALSGLSRLAGGLDAVKAALAGRRGEVQVPALDVAPFGTDTAVGRLLTRLAADSSEEELRSLGRLGDDERTRRDELRRTMGEIQARQAPQLRAAAERDAREAGSLRDDVAVIAKCLDQAAINSVKERERKLVEAKQAADLAARRFESEPMEEVGSPAWRALWEAARRYAEHVGQGLPADHEAALCPLCMQELDDEARTRLASFEEFVRDDVNSRLDELEAEKREALVRLPDVGAARGRHRASIALLGEGEDELGTKVGDWLNAATVELKRTREADLVGLTPLNPPPDLTGWIEGKDEEAARHRKIEDGEDNREIEVELADLDARHLLGECLADILARLKALKQIARLDAAIDKVGTGGVSRKIGSLSQEFVEAGLGQALNRQLEALELRGIEVLPKPRTVRGQTFVGLVLKSVEDVALTTVLSQGEQRRLALAMFLAEMEVRSDLSPIVLDDPTSSIDQEGRRRIARTLLKLGEKRQVIVFTHEMSLVLQLQRYSTGSRPVSVQHVRRLGDTVGHVRSSVPWDGMSAKRRRGELEQRLVQLRKVDEARDDEPYRKSAVEFCVDLRQAFERAVEDRVLAGVITRREDDVHTKQLRNLNCDVQICELVERGMDENSPWIHDLPLADGDSPPSPLELEEGLGVLTDLLKAVGELENGRKKTKDQEKPVPVADLKAVDLTGLSEKDQPHLTSVPDPPQTEVGPSPDGLEEQPTETVEPS